MEIIKEFDFDLEVDFNTSQTFDCEKVGLKPLKDEQVESIKKGIDFLKSNPEFKTLSIHVEVINLDDSKQEFDVSILTFDARGLAFLELNKWDEEAMLETEAFNLI
ncbi:MAG: hypothetical protein R6U15_01765 [Candidatus Izemoplasmatales bacterium]